MKPSGAPDAALLRFVEIARHQLKLLAWDEIEPSLAVSWCELREPGLPPWDSVAERVRSAAQGKPMGHPAAELRAPSD